MSTRNLMLVALGAALLAPSYAMAQAPIKYQKVFSNTFLTGVGAKVALTVSQSNRFDGIPHATFDRNVKLELSYTDLTGYHGNAPSLTMPYGALVTQVMKSGPTTVSENWCTTTLKKNGKNTFAGTCTIRLTGSYGDSNRILKNIKLAFGSQKWDSALGNNYLARKPDFAIDASALP